MVVKFDISKTKRDIEKFDSYFSSKYGEFYKNLSSDRGATEIVESLFTRTRNTKIINIKWEY